MTQDCWTQRRKDTPKSRSDTEQKVGLTAWETFFSTKALIEMDPLNIEEYDKRIIENMTTGSLKKNFRASLEKGTIWQPLFKKRKEEGVWGMKQSR